MTSTSDYKYVMIKNPVELRRNLLLTSKFVIQQMMYYEKIKLIREQKKKVIQELSVLSQEMGELYNKLLEMLPKPISQEMKKDRIIEEHSSKKSGRKKRSEKTPSDEEKNLKLSKIEKLYEVLKQLDERIEKLEKGS